MNVINDLRIWTCDADGSNFAEHLLDPRDKEEQTTVCGLRYEDVSKCFTDEDIQEDPLLVEFKDDRNWYNDHDRDDVVKCQTCADTKIGTLVS